MMYKINELRIGLKVIQNKEPCIIISNECVKPGKGLSFNRIRLKKIISGKILEKTLKSGEYLESANVRESKLIYVYRDKALWYFMNTTSFEQIAVPNHILKNSIFWITDQLSCVITFWNGDPILVTPPEYIYLKIIKTTPIIKNMSISSGSKLAIVSTGAKIKVPIFIQSGDLIKINTRSGTYISRSKSLI